MNNFSIVWARHNAAAEAAWRAAYVAIGKEPPKVPEDLLMSPSSSPAHRQCIPKQPKGAPKVLVERERERREAESASIDQFSKA